MKEKLDPENLKINAAIGVVREFFKN